MRKITRKALFCLLFTFILSVSVNAQTIFTENFSYTAGDSIGAHNWTGFSSFVNTIVITAPGLTFPGYVNSNIGNALTMKNSGQDAFKDATSSVTEDSYYLSFMLNVDTARTGDYFIALLPSGSTTAYNLRVHVKKIAATTYALGIGKGNTTDVLYNDAVTFPIGATIAVVAKYTFVSGTMNDILAVYGFTTSFPATEPAAPTVGPYPGTTSADLANINRVALRQGTAASSPTLKIDGIQVSKTWPKLVISGVNTGPGIADKFSLSQNYPNPFNPNTIINYQLQNSSFVSLNVYDGNGRLVRVLESGFKQIGTYNVNFSAEGLSSGMYFYSLYADGVLMDTKKAVVMK